MLQYVVTKIDRRMKVKVCSWHTMNPIMACNAKSHAQSSHVVHNLSLWGAYQNCKIGCQHAPNWSLYFLWDNEIYFYKIEASEENLGFNWLMKLENSRFKLAQDFNNTSNCWVKATTSSKVVVSSLVLTSIHNWKVSRY